ncbi:aminoglycoside phosphotransferase family protein [Desertihabitans aurantiacus]|uniref:aminoglycoside phosphotransferase family protein n=1 Tax=Desertihabitans aurantiacus TaxID=2282477 RepID=UPI000DF72A94|nr:phosphotransferase [Desertihabitans aurantiacus]
MALQLPATYLYGRRTTWPEVPAEVRDVVEGCLGEPVLGWQDRVGGMSVGLATVVHGATRSVFVKGLDGTSNPDGQKIYRREAAVEALLPRVPQRPALLAAVEVPTPGADWAVNVYPAVPGEPVRHPWCARDLLRVLDAWHALTPAFHRAPVTDDAQVSLFFEGWREVVADVDDPWRPLLEPWSERLATMTAAVDGTAADPPVPSHIDLRADNILLDRESGRVWFVDWSHPGLAAPWADLAILFADVVASGGDRADGGDVDVLQLWRSHPATAAFDPEWMVTVVVALAAALHLRSRRPPHPLFPHRRAWESAVTSGTEPFLRRHTR